MTTAKHGRDAHLNSTSSLSIPLNIIATGTHLKGRNEGMTMSAHFRSEFSLSLAVVLHLFVCVFV